MTDNWDRRCLVSILKKFYCNDALKPNHRFSRDGVFKSPDVNVTFAEVNFSQLHKSNDIQQSIHIRDVYCRNNLMHDFLQLKDYISSLPISDPPDLFGMNDNAERAHMESEALHLIDVIIQVQPKLATASVLQ